MSIPSAHLSCVAWVSLDLKPPATLEQEVAYGQLAAQLNGRGSQRTRSKRGQVRSVGNAGNDLHPQRAPPTTRTGVLALFITPSRCCPRGLRRSAATQFIG